MTQQQRVLATVGAVVGTLLAVGLLGLVTARDLNVANQVAGVAGAVIGLIGVGVSVYALKRPASPPVAGAAVTAGGDRAVAAGGSIFGDVSTGDHRSTAQGRGRRQTRSAPRQPPADPGGITQATGERSVAAGGDIAGDVSTGDGSSSGVL